MKNKIEENSMSSVDVGAPDSAPHGVRFLLTAIAGVAFAGLAAAVVFCASHGGPWVAELDDNVGEVVAARAQRLADVGERDEALEKYRRAMTLRFVDPQQRVWAGHGFTDLLLNNGLYEEAADVARSTLALDDEDGTPYSQLNRALQELGMYEAMLDNARAWHAWASAKGYGHTMGWAKYYEGVARLRLSHKEEAVQAFQEGFEAYPNTNPGVENAMAAARQLFEQDARAEARSYLRFVVDEATDWRRGEARQMLDELKDAS